MNWIDALKRRGGNLPNFAGKFVAIRCGPDGGEGVFEDVRIVKVGFSPFVVGRKAMREPPDQGGATNVTCWFGINAIWQMNIYDDIEAAWWEYERAARYPWLGGQPDSLESE